MDMAHCGASRDVLDVAPQLCGFAGGRSHNAGFPHGSCVLCSRLSSGAALGWDCPLLSRMPLDLCLADISKDAGALRT